MIGMADLRMYIDGDFAGEVTAGAGTNAVFAYAPSYLRQGRATPLSLSVPLIGGRHAVGAWLDGLLPDNDEVRREWAHANGAADTRPITLLGTPAGLDCAGAVQFCRPGREESLGREGGTLAAYRLAFGQPRQEELVELLGKNFTEEELEQLRIDLRPPQSSLRGTGSVPLTDG